MSQDRFVQQFLDDYFAECDEHLALIRRALLSLEDGAARGTPNHGALQDLFRGLHTLKGLSGMVAASEVERLAHALEDSLRAANAETGQLNEATLNVLFAGVRLLEDAINARRAGAEPLDINGFVASLDETAGRTQPVARPEAASEVIVPTVSRTTLDRERVRAAMAGGADVYRFAFAPTPDLLARGVGVEAVRTRLQTIGDLLSATPEMTDGIVRFVFLVALRGDAVPDEAWREDGLSWSAYEVEAAAPVASTQPAVVAPVRSDASIQATASSSTGAVRVELSRLDELMRIVGELVLSRARFDDSLRRMPFEEPGRAWDALQEINSALERQLRDLREGVMRVRLVPVGEVFERLRFVVRDVAREAGKQVRLEVVGENTELDKLVVDRMLEPLLHLIRNAVSHGLETPADRMATGKPPEGRLALRAATSGDRIVVEVEDDGAGIDVERVSMRAAALGLITPGAELSDAELLDVLCAPGFSTKDAADLTSGRGVGMAVVRSTIHELGGDLSLKTNQGLGTLFRIELPLTLMIVDALLVRVGQYELAVPQPVLREIFQVDRTAPVRYENNEILPYRGAVLPLLNLRRLFGVPADESTGMLNVLVVGTDAQGVGLVVDRVLGLREIVVHAVSDPLVAVPGVSGATELGDGRIGLILDAAALVALSREGAGAHRRGGAVNRTGNVSNERIGAR